MISTLFERISERQHEQVIFCTDKASGLRAIIAIHNSALGPALGGCRIKAYTSEDEALKDVLLLSEAMTYKSAAAGLDLGGGKSVVMLDHPSQKTPALLHALARRIHSLKGSYIGAGDIGSNTHDLALMRQITPWVTGLAREDGGLGDSSILTALGVFRGIQAAVKEKLRTEDLKGIRVAMQGAGKVGLRVLEHLHQAGCRIWLTDVSPETLREAQSRFSGIQMIAPDAFWDLQVDVISPNAIGGVITQPIAQKVKASVIAGGANNILADAESGQILMERGILYAPDFVINCGGVIMVGCEFSKKTFEDARLQTEAVYDRITAVFHEAKAEGIPTEEAAKRLALKRITAKL